MKCIVYFKLFILSNNLVLLSGIFSFRRARGKRNDLYNILKKEILAYRLKISQGL